MSKNNSGQKKFCEESEVEGRGRRALFSLRSFSSLRSLCSVGLAIDRTISDGLGSGSGSGLGKSCPNA